ncbi:MAG: hypothetical protein ACJ72A_00150 [Nocardioidaceae bacterium]
MPDADLSSISLGDVRVLRRDGGTSSVRLSVEFTGCAGEVELTRARKSRLRYAYPVGEHDVEVALSGFAAPGAWTEVLGRVVAAVEETDPFCRRVVIATDIEDLDALRSAESAGFRYVLDVDLQGGSYRLAVAEPEWVTSVDMDLDRVPSA